ncbi:Zinc finger, CCHC-type [Cinara cedri]|uniref:Zinc finger, CCHC-type n=1 Tax=Cinara cedri TaxID=506608 RepID=A0A5E4MTL8_9HEMI|nr:Zinc finger, CCHC-type [Cinara cedri]
MRKTRASDLLVKLTRSKKAVIVADKLRSILVDKLGSQTGTVSSDDPIVASNKADVTVTRIWTLKSGQQVATVRAPEPTRCYRCYGYGHATKDCNDPDLHESCRRCGIAGHKETGCTDGGGKYVACDRTDLKGTQARISD